MAPRGMHWRHTACAYGVDESEIVPPRKTCDAKLCKRKRRCTHHLDVGQLILIARLDILLLPDMGHVAPVVDAILVIRRVRRVVDEAIHALPVDSLVEVVDVGVRRLVPARRPGSRAGGLSRTDQIESRSSDGGMEPGRHDDKGRDGEAGGDVQQGEEVPLGQGRETGCCAMGTNFEVGGCHPFELGYGSSPQQQASKRSKLPSSHLIVDASSGSGCWMQWKWGATARRR